MREHTYNLSRRAFLGGAATFGAVSLVTPSLAFADPTAAEKQAEADAVRVQVTEMQSQLNQASDDYFKALSEHDAAIAAVEAAQVRIDETNAEITSIQGTLGVRARSMYRSGGTSFLDILLGASTFEEFSTNWDVLNELNQNDADMVQQTKTLRTEVEAQKVELAKQEKIAADKTVEAKKIKDQAEATVVELDSILSSLDAEARALLEKEQTAAREAEAAAAAAKAAQEAQREPSGGSNSPSTPDYSPPSGGGDGGTSYGNAADAALSKIGCPYVWAAEGPSSFDCSGLVTWAYRQVGINLPHQSESQYAAATWRGPVSQARKGDVLWRYAHVGIACNDGGSWYVHAPTFGALVRDTDSLSWSGFTHALRF